MPSKKYIFITTKWMGTGTVDEKKKKKEANMNSGLETDCLDGKEHIIDRTSQSTFTYNLSQDPHNTLKLWFPAHMGLTESNYAK